MPGRGHLNYEFSYSADYGGRFVIFRKIVPTYLPRVTKRNTPYGLVAAGVSC